MIKKPNKSLVGAFVLGSVILVIAGIVTFGSGRYFITRPAFVMYFEGSVKGLSIGAPVVFKGVKVGSVTDIGLRFNPDTLSVLIPVFIELEPHIISQEKGPLDPHESIKLLIDEGLKAQLQLQNLITGQLIIELDFHPDKPLNLTRSDMRHTEIPTIPSSLEEFTKTIEKLPIEDMVNTFSSAIRSIEKAVTSPELVDGLHSMNIAITDLSKLIKDINSHIDPLSSEIKGTLIDSRKMIKNLDKQISSLDSSLKKASMSTSAAMEQAKQTFGTMEKATAGDSPVMYQLSQTLEEISLAARSIRVLSDYLSRHPEALISGKGETGGKQGHE